MRVASPPCRPRARADEATLRAAVRDGALVVDTRAPAEFLAEHLEEAINIPLGRSFLTWAGSVLDPEREIVLLVSPAERHLAPEAIHDLALIGFDRVLGAMAATDLSALAPRDLSSIPVMPAADIGAAPNATIIDVRSEAEWNEGHIPGARHFPLTQLAARAEELRDAAADRRALPGRSAQLDRRERAARLRHSRRHERGRWLRRVGAHARAGRGREVGPLTSSSEPRLRRLVLIGAGRANLHLLRGLSRSLVRGLEIVLVTPDGEMFDPSMTSGLLRGAYDLATRASTSRPWPRGQARASSTPGPTGCCRRRAWWRPAASVSRSTSA